MFCPMCGSPYDESDHFCGQCGYSLHPDPIPILEASPPDDTSPRPGEEILPPPPAVTFEYAGLLRRFTAFLIDSVLLLLVIVIVTLPAGVFYSGISRPDNISEVLTGLFSMRPDSGVLRLFGILTGFLVSWLYYALFESSNMQASPGKKIAGMMVSGFTGTRISFDRATLRHFCKMISAVICFIGFFMISFTGKKQGLHDIIAGCVVLKTR